MIEKYQLKNGMSILLVESDKSPVVTVQMWVKTGSADEKKGLEGISHFIEHLVFKGSEKYGVGEMANTIESAGGEINAYTTFDQTVFHVTLSKAFTDTGLEIISEMMGRPKFDKKEIDNEREVVIEEIKRSHDSPQQQASRLLFKTMYKKHPYGVPVIGYDDNIRRVSREEIVKYYQQRYLPQNMNLVVVGDFKSGQMKKKIARYFGQMQRLKLVTVKRSVEPKKNKPIVVVKGAPFAESFLYLSWPVPKANHKDIIALTLIAAIIGQGESSRLVRHIKNERHLVNSIGSGLFTPKESGFFAISAGLNHAKLSETLKYIQDEVQQFLENGPTYQELEKAVRLLESERFYSMETVDGLAGLYGHFEFLYNDYKAFDKILKKMESVRPKDLVTIAKKYLRPATLSATYMTSGDVIEAQETLNRWEKTFRKHTGKIKTKITTIPSKVDRPGLRWKKSGQEKSAPANQLTLSSGVRVLFKKIKGAPVVSVRYGFLGGLRGEDKNYLGLNELVSRVWATSTKGLSEIDLNNKIESMASYLGAFGGRNSLGISMTALEPNFSETLKITNDVLLRSEIVEKIVSREKQLMLEYLKTRNDKPAQKCILNLTKELFLEHPYARDVLGNEASIAKLFSKQIKEHLEKVVSVSNMVISLVGDINIKALEKELLNVTMQMNKTSSVPDKLSMQPLKESINTFLELDKAQTHIAIAFRGLTFQDEDRYVLDVMQSILSGQGGRLFVELRDKESLAYTVAPLRMDGIEPGYFGVYIGCSPEKSEKAVQMMRSELHKLTEKLVSEAEMQRSKRYLLGRHDIGLQRTGQIADLMLFDELYGRKFNEYEKFQEKLSAVTPSQIRSLAEKLFSQPHVLSVVGKRNVGK
ncbi:MAG: hypothetical protein A2Z20_01760 [Bdellovibrionales bacterium RBG_16_40_8]|nr:MAG: hypothetical protein A2Z20_01760 [Bdellovibrionales bacterium RBG_16_40_8]